MGEGQGKYDDTRLEYAYIIECGELGRVDKGAHGLVSVT